MKTQAEIEKMRDDAYAKALECQSKSSEAYFANDKSSMNEYSELFGKYLAKYQAFNEVLK